MTTVTVTPGDGDEAVVGPTVESPANIAVTLDATTVQAVTVGDPTVSVDADEETPVVIVEVDETEVITVSTGGAPGATGPQGIQGIPGPQGPAGAAGGGTQQSLWMWRAGPVETPPGTVVAPPASGRVAFSHDDTSVPGRLYISRFAFAGGIDWSLVMTTLAVDDHIYIQKFDDAASFHRWTITAPAFLVGTNHRFSVVTDSVSGVEPTDGTNCLLAFQFKETPGATGPTGPAGVTNVTVDADWTETDGLPLGTPVGTRILRRI
jgi:hypothetical protein